MHGKQMTARFVLAASFLFLVLAGAAGAGTTPLRPASEDGILMFASEDGQFKWWLDARLNIDGSFFVEDKNSLGDGVQLRRSRIGLKAILWGDWYVETDVDFAEEAVAMKDFYIRYDNLLNRTAYVRVGNFREPFGLEENTTSRNLLFPERSQGLDGFVPGRKVGVEAAHFGPSYRFAAGLFGPDAAEYETEADDMTFNATARANFNMLRTETSVLHLGVAGSLRRPQFDSGMLRFRTRNEYHVNNYKFVDTDNISGVERYNLVDGEFAYVNRRLRLQSECTAVNVRRDAYHEDLAFNGAYVSASVFLTADTHPYEWQSAEFGRVVPKSARGAWELAARYSTVDMNDHDVLGGKSSATTLGVNWYANANIRVYADLVFVNNDEHATAKGALNGDDDYKFFEFRFQTAF